MWGWWRWVAPTVMHAVGVAGVGDRDLAVALGGARTPSSSTARPSLPAAATTTVPLPSSRSHSSHTGVRPQA